MVDGEVDSPPVVGGPVGVGEVRGVELVGDVGSVVEGRCVLGVVASVVVGPLVVEPLVSGLLVGWMYTGVVGPPPPDGSGVGRTRT